MVSKPLLTLSAAYWASSGSGFDSVLVKYAPTVDE